MRVSTVTKQQARRATLETVTEELDAAGYSFIDTFRFLPRQYYLVFQKRDP